MTAGRMTAPFVAASAVLLASAAAPPDRPRGDVVCGPRCVVDILARYGRDEDLVTLVRETQWPRIDDGASLAALQEALHARDIHTAAIRLTPESDLRWPHPVLVHLEAESSETGLGQYVVWLPESRPGCGRGCRGFRR